MTLVLLSIGGLVLFAVVCGTLISLLSGAATASQPPKPDEGPRVPPPVGLRVIYRTQWPVHEELLAAALEAEGAFDVEIGLDGTTPQIVSFKVVDRADLAAFVSVVAEYGLVPEAGGER